MLIADAVGKAAYFGAKALSDTKPLSKSAIGNKTNTSDQPTGCVIDNNKYFYFFPAYCKKRGGLVTSNFNVECRFNNSPKREITQEWRCKQNGGYVHTAVSPNIVTGVLKAQALTKSTSAPPAPASKAEGKVKCELKKSGVITGYVEVSEQICRDLTGG
ncbi:hypothetical protein XMM312_000409 [Marinobacterium sp. xm-m-312]|nr:hypothetical protein [Marinobacterium sp. xm-m-312]